MYVVEISVTMLIKFVAVVIVTPLFLFPSVIVALAGAWCGQVYIKAQLSVKREMSNAKSPVLSQYVYMQSSRTLYTDDTYSFGAAIAGLSKYSKMHCQTQVRLTFIQHLYVHMAFKRLSRKNLCLELTVIREPHEPSTTSIAGYAFGSTRSEVSLQRPLRYT